MVAASVLFAYKLIVTALDANTCPVSVPLGTGVGVGEETGVSVNAGVGDTLRVAVGETTGVCDSVGIAVCEPVGVEVGVRGSQIYVAIIWSKMADSMAGS